MPGAALARTVGETLAVDTLLGLEFQPMTHHDVQCELCDRVVNSEDVESERCSGCGVVICDEHSGEPPGDPHQPEDHISPDDVEDEGEPIAER